jgi:hypothetical protein
MCLGGGGGLKKKFSPFQAILSNFGLPYHNPFWEKSYPAEEREKERREKTPLIVDT